MPGEVQKFSAKQKSKGIIEYIKRVPEFMYLRRNWVPPPPPPSKYMCLPPSLGSWRDSHTLAGEGVGGPDSDEGTETLELYVYYNPSRTR
jgi:hypothetical protein